MVFSYRMFLVDDQSGQLTRMNASKALAAYQGHGALPEYAGRDIRVLAALCMVESRKVTGVASVEGYRMRILADGTADREPIERYWRSVMASKMDPAPSKSQARRDPAAYFAAQQDRNGARWEPTAAQRAAALSLLSAKPRSEVEAARALRG